MSRRRLPLVLAALTLLGAAFFLGEAAFRQSTAITETPAAWLELHGAAGVAPRLNDGLVLPPGAMLRTVVAQPRRRAARFTVRVRLSSAAPFEIGVASQGLTNSFPIDRATFGDSPVISLEVDPNGVRVYHDGDLQQDAPAAPGPINAFFIYAKWAPIQLDAIELVDLSGPQPVTIGQADFGGSQSGRRLGLFLACLAALAALLGFAWRLGVRAELPTAPLVAGWLVLTLAASASAFFVAGLPPAPYLFGVIALGWLTFRLRFWLVNTDVAMFGRARSWRLVAYLLATGGALIAAGQIGGPFAALVALLGCLGLAATLWLEAPTKPLAAARLVGPFLVPVGLTALVATVSPTFGWWLLPFGVLIATAPLSWRRAHLRGYGVYMLLATVVFFLAAEGALRQGPTAPYLQPRGVDKAHLPDDTLFWVPAGLFGYDGDFPYAGGRLTRAVRFRGDENAPLEKPAGVTRIITIGGSNVWGDGQETAATTWSALLEDDLRTRGSNVEVLNAGVRGFDSAQFMALFTKYAVHYDPDVVVVYAGLNDSGNPLGLLTLRELWLAQQAGRPVAVAQRTLARSALYNALTRGVIQLRRRLADHGLGTFLKGTKPVADYRDNLIDVIRAAQDNGARVMLATEFQGNNFTGSRRGERAVALDKAMSEAAAQTGSLFFDAWTYFATQEDPLSFVWPHDPTHFNDEGHREMARLVSEALLKNGLLEK
jgi:lysophospholipase L1-like esterase